MKESSQFSSFTASLIHIPVVTIRNTSIVLKAVLVCTQLTGIIHANLAEISPKLT